MKRLFFPFALTLAALAAPAFADESEIPAGTDWEALLIGAIEANDCKMTEDEAAIQLPPLGFGQEWTVYVLESLVEKGSLVLDEESQTVIAKTEVCR